MDTRTALLTAILFTVSFFPALVQASNVWPEPDCDGDPYWLTFADMDFCISKNEIEHLNHLYLSSPSLHVSFKPDESVLTELTINGLSARKTTGELHSQLGFSVYELFYKVFSGEVIAADNLELVNTVMTIDNDATLLHFTKHDLDAFVILRASSLWDEIYILKEGRDGSIQLSGQFDASQVEWLLARFRL